MPGGDQVNVLTKGRGFYEEIGSHPRTGVDTGSGGCLHLLQLAYPLTARVGQVDFASR